MTDIDFAALAAHELGHACAAAAAGANAVTITRDADGWTVTDDRTQPASSAEDAVDGMIAGALAELLHAKRWNVAAAMSDIYADGFATLARQPHSANDAWFIRVLPHHVLIASCERLAPLLAEHLGAASPEMLRGFSCLLSRLEPGGSIRLSTQPRPPPASTAAAA